MIQLKDLDLEKIEVINDELDSIAGGDSNDFSLFKLPTVPLKLHINPSPLIPTSPFPNGLFGEHKPPVSTSPFPNGLFGEYKPPVSITV